MQKLWMRLSLYWLSGERTRGCTLSTLTAGLVSSGLGRVFSGHSACQIWMRTWVQIPRHCENIWVWQYVCVCSPSPGVTENNQRVPGPVRNSTPKVWWRAIKEDVTCLALATTIVYTITHTYNYTHIHKFIHTCITNECTWAHTQKHAQACTHVLCTHACTHTH